MLLRSRLRFLIGQLDPTRPYEEQFGEVRRRLIATMDYPESTARLDALIHLALLVHHWRTERL
jgi:hypothetical protein